MIHERRAFAVGFAIALVFGALVFTARPHVVERWALYLGSPQAPSAAHLFLDPFPSAYSCRTRVRLFIANAERAFCTSYYAFEVGSASDALLAADFDASSPAAWFCLPRRRSPFPVARVRPRP